MFVFQYTLTENDYIAFNEYHMAYSPAAKVNRRVYRFLVPIIILLLFLFAWKIIDDSVLLAAEGAVLLVCCVLSIVFERKIFKRSIRQQVKRLAKTGKLPFSGEIVLRFEEIFFTEISPDSENKMSYTKIERIMVGKYILIYIGSIQALILPSYVFHNKEHWDAFFMFLKTKTSAPMISMQD